MSQAQAHATLERYDKLSKLPGFVEEAGPNAGWVWKDSYIIRDFKTLKAPPALQDASLRVDNMISFYTIYFGEISTPVNVGALFAQILSTAPSFQEDDDNLFEFIDGGDKNICMYRKPEGIQEAFTRFCSTLNKKPDDHHRLNIAQPDIAPPIEPEESNLLLTDEDQRPEAQVPEGQLPPPSYDAAPQEESGYLAFRDNIIKALMSLSSSNKETVTSPDASLELLRLHRTATFLIFIMLRRITKRPEDLERAFSKGNIHKHYADMVKDPFGLCIPMPAPGLNRSLDSVLSTNSEAGRHIGTLLLYLFSTCATTATDAPVGLLDQKNIGLEALLRATCMTHIGGAGLPLINLFIMMQSLYQLTERQALEWINYPEFSSCVVKIMNVRERQYHINHGTGNEAKDTTKLFPYCRLIHQKYHPELGHRGNEDLCFFLACLVDLKKPPEDGTGGACMAVWTRGLNNHHKANIMSAAKMLFKETSHFKLTKMYPNQISFQTSASVGRAWTAPETINPASDTTESLDENDLVPII